MSIQDREKKYIQSKKHLSDIKTGKAKPDKVVRPKKSIYEDFVDKHSLDLVEAMEKEIYRNITTFKPKVASKRIMELIWQTRWEW